MNKDYLKNLNILIEDLENRGFYKEASEIHSLFIKQAKNKFKPVYEVEFPMNLDDALNNYDSSSYEIDVEGDWEETETINDFREEASDSLLHSPAAVDDNHLVFFNEDEDHIEVMNMIPKHHLDTLHNNPSKKTKWVKRAEFEKDAGRIKVKPDTDVDALFKYLIREKKMDIKCEDLIDMVYDIIRKKGLEPAGIDLYIDKRGHLTYKDPMTGETSTESCHFQSKQGQFNPSEITKFLGKVRNSIRAREGIAITANSTKWIKVSKSSNHGGLDDWFKKEKWVDVSRPKKDGKGYEPCGRGDTSKGKKPVCTPANKAKNLTDKERKNRIKQKRQKEKEPNPDKKPNITKYSPGAGGKSNIS